MELLYNQIGISMMKQSSQVPQIVESRICHLAESLPAHTEEKDKLINKYSLIKGYQFLSPKSKLHRHFNYKYSQASDLRAKKMQMQNQIKITMEGNLEQISVGAMCQIFKQNLRKGTEPYQPSVGQQYQQQFVFERDQELFTKTIKLLHNINLSRLQSKNESIQSNQETTHQQKSVDKIIQSRKEMTVKDDGSLGVWGGKKYEGLGSQNQFTNFRREQSMNYYQNTYFQSSQKKKI